MKYWAFLSYSHTDKKWGDWLHKALETYRVPRRLIGKETRDGKVPERVYPIFRDREELPVSADLGSNINEALKESRYLVVICSPRSAQSRWVGEEIKTFKKLGREDRILALIVDGEPNASDGKPGFKVEDECFHEGMRYRVVDGEPTEIRSEPIAADAREGKDGKANAKLKLLAGLLGVNYDDLKQREQERRLRRARLVVTCAVVLIGIFAALSVALFFNARAARQARDEARATLSRIYFLQAVRSIEEDKDLDALARLARSVVLDRRNNAAVCRLTTLLAGRNYAIPVSHSGVKIAKIGRDGKRVVALSDDKTARVWDVETNRVLTEPMAHAKPVRLANFSPDGRRIVTVAGDLPGYDVTAKSECAVRAWDASTGKPLSEPMVLSSLTSAEFSPDGKYVVTASLNGLAQVWNAETGKARTEPLTVGNTIFSAEFSPDSKRIVTSSQNIMTVGVLGTAQVWDAETGKPLIKPIEHNAPVTAAHFSPEGERVLTVSAKAVRVWDSTTGNPLTEPMNHDGYILCAQFSPDGKRLLAGGMSTGYFGALRVWDAKTGKPVTDPIQQDGVVYFAQFSSDSKRILTSSSKKTARVWDATRGKPLTEPMKDAAIVAEFSPDSRHVITATADDTCIWDTRPRESLPLSLNFDSAHFSPDSQRIVVFSRYNDVALVCDAATGEPLTHIYKGGISSAEFSPNGKRIVTVSADDAACVWDATTGKPVTQPMELRRWALSAQFTPKGDRVVTSSSDSSTSEVRVWDAETGKPLTDPIKVDGTNVKTRVSPDGKRIATMFFSKSSGPVTQIWDALTGKAVGDLMKGVNTTDFSPDSKRIVTASLQGGSTARVWDLETGKPLTDPMKHNYAIVSLQFSPNGQQILTIAGDVRVWDAGTGKPLSEPMVSDKRLLSAQFSADAKRIIMISDGGVQIWDAEMFKPVSETMRFEQGTKSGEFSPNGERVIGVSDNGQVRIWDITPRGQPPEWLPVLADAIAGQRLNDLGFFESVSKDTIDTLKQIRARLETNRSKEDHWAIWGRWFLQDPQTRTISPFSKTTVPEYIKARLKENTADSLEEAEQLAVGNPELLNAERQKLEKEKAEKKQQEERDDNDDE